jgi:ketopantoate reductase
LLTLFKGLLALLSSYLNNRSVTAASVALEWLNLKMSRDADRCSNIVQLMLLGRFSELDWINSFIIKRGKRHGIACDTHQGLMDIIKRKIDRNALEIVR